MVDNKRPLIFALSPAVPPSNALNIPAIAAALDACGGLARRFNVDVLTECDSSNSHLMTKAEAGAPSGTVIVAERQTAGRGRRGRSWLSAPGDSLTFSLLWRFPANTPLAGLSLAVGVALARAFEAMGIKDIALKWPNDVLLHERKLAGILVELVSGPPVERSHAAIIGIGVNLRLSADLPDDIRTNAASLDDANIRLPDVNTLLARLLAELYEQLEAFLHAGFSATRTEWLQRNAHADQPVRLLADFAEPLDGICRGVAEDGALLLETAHGTQRIISGEVSLRPRT